jgi:outer membrane protein assembly factor BamD (BamD/ComL family)
MTEEQRRPLKVFLCHASGDKPAVRELHKYLRREGVNAWLDEEELLPGQDWDAEIMKALQEVDAIIICLSKASVSREGYVHREIKEALRKAEEKPFGTIFVIPAKLDDCDVPTSLRNWHWVELFAKNGYEQLMRSLRRRAKDVGAVMEDDPYIDTTNLERSYTEGSAALWVEDWDKAIHHFQIILREQPNHRQAAQKLAAAKRQKYLHTLYCQALDAQKGENWQAAIEALEKLTSEMMNYKDAALLLEKAQKKKQWLDLYEEARQLHQAKQWQAVVKVFAQIAVIEPGYADPDDLLASAEKEVAELKRLAALHELYSQGVRQMDEGHWYEARKLLEQVHKAEPNFLEIEGLLNKLKVEITKIEELQRLTIQISALYEQAHGFLHSKNWQKAFDKIEEIQKLDNKFEDKDGIAEKARAALAVKGTERSFPTPRRIVFLIVMILFVSAAIYAIVNLRPVEPFAKAAGEWKAVDKDKSEMTLSITRTARGAYKFVYYDTQTSTCQGGAAIAQFEGVSIESSISAPIEFHCNATPWEFANAEITLLYDADQDRLTDSNGITWHRAP